MENNQLTVVTDSDLMQHLNNLGLANGTCQKVKEIRIYKSQKAFNLNPFKRDSRKQIQWSKCR